MAQAVKHLFPDAKFGIGPSIENGFYYDFDIGRPFEPDDLNHISEEMQKIIRNDFPFVKTEKSREQAIKYFKELKQPYKIELLEDIPDEKVTLYQNGDFIDLCRGPHISSTGKIKHFKLLSIAGAYWRGDEDRPMLQRIYGTAFLSEQELKDYIQAVEEAKKRDHRVLGKALDLYSIQESAGPGLVFWHPHGAIVRHIIEEYLWTELSRAGYQPVYTPHIACLNLWKTSGHWDFYREYMYSPIKVEESEYLLRPMNCPGHVLIYKSRLRSYRELPIRFAELGTVYRYERPGVLHGLLRARGFTQDDAHIFCTADQIDEEIYNLVELTLKILRTFGFSEFSAYLSTRPDKFVGNPERWEKATSALRKAAERANLKYGVDEGGGVFYGPKLDIKIKDSLGRAWQCSTIQVDFNLPKRFGVLYISKDGSRQQAIMIHRALLGSLERFFGVLIEHYAGAFPLWLAPVQIRVMNITDAVATKAEEIAISLSNSGFRVDTDIGNLLIRKKIFNAETEKIPYMIVIGKKEVENGTVSVRRHGVGDIGVMPLEQLVSQLNSEIEKKEVATGQKISAAEK
jgi:threonyl-tRNA synthetase